MEKKKKAFSRRLKDSDVTLEGKVLEILADGRPRRTDELGALLPKGYQKSSLAPSLSKLRRKGLIIRETLPHNAREAVYMSVAAAPAPATQLLERVEMFRALDGSLYPTLRQAVDVTILPALKAALTTPYTILQLTDPKISQKVFDLFWDLGYRRSPNPALAATPKPDAPIYMDAKQTP